MKVITTVMTVRMAKKARAKAKRKLLASPALLR